MSTSTLNASTRYLSRPTLPAARHFYKVDEGGPGADLGPVPDQPDLPSRIGLTFEPKSSAARADAGDVLDLISKINQTPPDDFAAVMEETIDMDAFLQTMAVMLFSGDSDQLTGWNPHNYYLYHDLQRDRWHYLPWDLDVGFADNAFGRVAVISGWNAAWPIPGGPPRPLIERIVDNPQLLAHYRRFADEILEKHFHPQVLLPRIDALYAQVKEDLANDPFPHRRITNPEDRDYASVVASIKDFVRKRYATARAQLDNPGAQPAIVRNARRQSPQPGPPSPDAPSELHVMAQTASSDHVALEGERPRCDGLHCATRQRRTKPGVPQLHWQTGPQYRYGIRQQCCCRQTYRYRVYAVRPTPAGPQGTGLSNTITVHVPDR